MGGWTGEEDKLNLALSPMPNWSDKVGVSQRIPGDWLFRVSMGLPGVVEPECLDTLRVFFLIHLFHCPVWFRAGLFLELGFGTLVQRFWRLWLQFLLVAFPLAGPETGAAKHAAPFGLKTLKAFNMHLNTPFKVQLWAAMFQASMFCNRQSLGDSCKIRHKRKPDWSLICNYDQ